jgi:hypothetical protein
MQHTHGLVDWFFKATGLPLPCRPDVLAWVQFGGVGAGDGQRDTLDVVPALATLLRTWRERALLTQEQLAHLTALGVYTVRRLESDGLRRPRGDSLRLFADALNPDDDDERALLVAIAEASGGQTRPAPASGVNCPMTWPGSAAAVSICGPVTEASRPPAPVMPRYIGWCLDKEDLCVTKLCALREDQQRRRHREQLMTVPQPHLAAAQ